ncbi:MAG: diaminopimelate decarboxylase, partial [Lentisphaeria bacterium]|nr:diaminopimelate decarboxylase [Lentisphaeria bacterium]
MKFVGEKIAIGDVLVSEIAEKYGTPTYVYDEEKIRKNFRKVDAAFKKYYPDFKMFYAVKSCNNPA